MGDSSKLRLGPEVVRRLLPHRHPMLMVDAVDDFDPGPRQGSAGGSGPRPSLRAHRHISLNEMVFDGHCPDRAIWPGVLIIEGLAQSCHLLSALAGLRGGFIAAGREPDEAMALLRELDAALRPASVAPERAGELAARLVAIAPPRIGLLALAARPENFRPSAVS